MALSPLASGIITSGIDAGLGVLGGLFGESRSQKAWKKQAYYNSPAEQMKRLKLAGLNPNLVYGSGQVANTQSSPHETAKPDLSDTGSKGLQAYVQASQLEMQKDINALQQLLLQEQINDKKSIIEFRDSIQTDKGLMDIELSKTSLEEKKKLLAYIDSDKQLDQMGKAVNIEHLIQQIDAFPVRLQNEIFESRARVSNLNMNTSKQKIEKEMLELAKKLRENNVEVSDHLLIRLFAGAIKGGTDFWKESVKNVVKELGKTITDFTGWKF